MFEGGVPEQLRHLMASPSEPQPPPPPLTARTLPFPLSFTSFDTQYHFLDPILHPQQPQLISHKIDHHDIKECINTDLVCPTDHPHGLDHGNDDGDGDGGHQQHPWSTDEVLALLRIRSTTENWFPDFTWEHASRKLTELGFKRTPQECKEKFEDEESRYFNNHNNNNINSYNTKESFRMVSELEELYRHDANVSSEDQNMNKALEEPNRKESYNCSTGQELEEPPREGQDLAMNRNEANNGNVENGGSTSPRRSKKKRKRERFEMMKGFCEGFVKHMIAMQEEMQKKLLEDMVKMDEENIAREQAWKKQVMERIRTELDIRAHEQTIASDTNATVFKFMNKFASLNGDQLVDKEQNPGTAATSSTTSQSSSSVVLPQNHSTSASYSSKDSKIPTLLLKNPSSTPNAPTASPQTLSLQNTNSSPTQEKPLGPIAVSMQKTNIQNPKLLHKDEKYEICKRWPRDEVLALINIRCSLYNSNGDRPQEHNQQGSASSKALPLWERISRKMVELGYKKSAKRCKEKWENINKYFRKTKDVNKKRPVDSRTCPYFHKLSTLYSQGALVAGTGGGAGSDNPEKWSPRNPSRISEK